MECWTEGSGWAMIPVPVCGRELSYRVTIGHRFGSSDKLRLSAGIEYSTVLHVYGGSPRDPSVRGSCWQLSPGVGPSVDTVE